MIRRRERERRASYNRKWVEKKRETRKRRKRDEEGRKSIGRRDEGINSWMERVKAWMCSVDASSSNQLQKVDDSLACWSFKGKKERCLMNKERKKFWDRERERSRISANLSNSSPLSLLNSSIHTCHQINNMSGWKVLLHPFHSVPFQNILLHLSFLSHSSFFPSHYFSSISFKVPIDDRVYDRQIPKHPTTDPRWSDNNRDTREGEGWIYGKREAEWNLFITSFFSKVTHFQSSKSNIYEFSPFFIHSHSFIDRNKKILSAFSLFLFYSFSLSLSILLSFSPYPFLDVLKIKSSARNKTARSTSKRGDMKGDSIGTVTMKGRRGKTWNS